MYHWALYENWLLFYASMLVTMRLIKSDTICSLQNLCNDHKLLVANTLRQRSLKCQSFTLTIRTGLKIMEKRPHPSSCH